MERKEVIERLRYMATFWEGQAAGEPYPEGEPNYEESSALARRAAELLEQDSQSLLFSPQVVIR